MTTKQAYEKIVRAIGDDASTRYEVALALYSRLGGENPERSGLPAEEWGIVNSVIGQPGDTCNIDDADLEFLSGVMDKFAAV